MSQGHITDHQPNWGVKLPQSDDVRDPNRPYRRMSGAAKAVSLLVSFAIIVATGYAYYLLMGDTLAVLVIPLGLAIGFAFVAWLYRRYDDLHEI